MNAAEISASERTQYAWLHMSNYEPMGRRVAHGIEVVPWASFQ